jgi:hypothetical protein
MDTQPIPSADAEQQWIAKYRRAIEANIPVQPSRSAGLKRRMVETLEGVMSSVGKILEHWMRVQSPPAETSIRLSATRIDPCKLHPQTVRYGGTAGKSARGKAS